MTNDNEKLTIKDAVLGKIKTGQLSMRPKVYFSIKVALLTLVALAVLVISILIFMYISFSVRISGQEALLGFGARGFIVFLQLFPWWLLAVDIALIFALESLLRQFRFGYQSPVLYLFAAIAVVTIGFGLFIDRATPLNDRLLDRADARGLPGPLGNFYQNARRGPGFGSVCRCLVVEINGNTITAYNADTGTSSTYLIRVPSNNPHATTSLIEEGDIIFIAGERRGEYIEAFGISKFPPKPLNPPAQ